MIWIVGEYAERIDNADELLESFLEGFQDENSQVQYRSLSVFVMYTCYISTTTFLSSFASFFTTHSVAYFLMHIHADCDWSSCL